MGKTSSKIEKRNQKKADSGFSAMRTFIFLLIIVLLAVGTTMLFGQQATFARVTAKSQQLAEQEAQAKQNYEEVLALKQKVGSDSYTEDIARNQLGMLQPGETVYKTK